jgi:hypothetical protein
MRSLSRYFLTVAGWNGSPGCVGHDFLGDCLRRGLVYFTACLRAPDSLFDAPSMTDRRTQVSRFGRRSFMFHYWNSVY